MYFMFYNLIFLINIGYYLIDAEKMEPSIVIIGAGLSGFSAAARLIENNFTNLIVLEAEDRIGGRVHSVKYFEGNFIDNGAQWIHGEKDNIIYQIAHKYFDFGSTAFDQVDQTFLLSNGSKPDQNTCRKVLEIAYKILEDDDDEMEDYEGSLGSFMLKKIYEKLNEPQYKKINRQLIPVILNSIESDINGYYGSKSWFNISAKLDAKYDEAKGNQHLTWKKKGFITVFDFITKKAFGKSNYLDIQNKVQLNKKVVNIKYDSNEVMITTSDGTKYFANHVIFTASLGVLKKYHRSLFNPNLPQYKITAIEKNAFGAVGKFFIEFEKPFWSLDRDSFVAYSFLWNEAEKKEAIRDNREWLFSISGFFIVDQYPNLLEAFLGGEKIDEFEKISNEKLIDDCVWMFEKFLGNSIAKPKLIQRTKWLNNENFLGTYSYVSVDAYKFNVGPKDLAKTLKNSDDKPIVLFAGEATDLKFPSYAHGAVTSGYRAAHEIIDYYIEDD
ncbi:hypothetical protein PVAND_003665 [Polypedilum vanderplanki]|uniref:Amine oxidase n=1 Tax=Polypedilum vanderplanki TaxID=319348 RepID=A0A9J6BUR9_POLVA|nr:hypothetical protein PVAND_003665 [Polypedilum vanderplanki]